MNPIKGLFTQFRTICSLILIVPFCVFVGSQSASATAPLAPGFAPVRVLTIADNDFAIFMGNDSNVTRLFHQNDDSWQLQIQTASELNVIPNAGETFLYVVAMGGSEAENWAGTINGKDVVSYPGAQVAKNGNDWLRVNTSFTGFNTGSGSVVENGKYNVVTAQLQTALNGATWSSAKSGDPGVPTPRYNSAVCCGGYRIEGEFKNGVSGERNTYTIFQKGFTGYGWDFPTSSAVVYRYPLSAAELPVSPGDSQVIVDWQAPVGGEAPAEYLVDYKETSQNDNTFKPFAVVNAPTTISTVTGLTNGTSYTFRVAGRSAAGEVGLPTISISVTPTGPASRPTNLSYQALNSSVSVGFSSPENNGGFGITNYQYSIANGTWVTRSPISVGTPIEISGLTNGTQTSIRIRAVTPFGVGAESESLSVTAGVITTRTISYSKGTLDSVTGLASGGIYSQGDTATVLSGPTRANFRFTGWKSGVTTYQPGDVITVGVGNINLNAQWAQSSMYGVSAADKQQVLKWTIAGLESINTTVSAGDSSVQVNIPSSAFDPGTEVIFWRLLSETAAKQYVDSSKNYFLNIALTWSKGDDITSAITVPTARSPIQITIANAGITIGTKIWKIVDGIPTKIGTATQNGQVTVSFIDDPLVVGASLALGAPASAAISEFSVPNLTYNSASTLSATSNVAGIFTFKVGGQNISGCESKSATGSLTSYVATCSYTPVSADPVTFTLDFAPTDNLVYDSITNSSPTIRTPAKIATTLGGFSDISKSVSSPAFQLVAPTVVGSIPGSFTYTVSNPVIASITSPSTITPLAVGTVVITATFTPDFNGYASSTRTLNLTVSSLANTITFAALNAVTVLTTPFNLTATATGGTVTYSTATSSSICTLNNGLVTPVGPGTCIIVASSNGNAVYGAASSVTQTLAISAVAPGAPTITSLSVGGTSDSDNTSGYATIRYSGTVENGASISSFTLIATPDSGTVISTVVNLAAGTRTSTITGLTLGTRYTFTVKATNSIGSSVDSNSISKTPTANPKAPTNLIVTPGNATLVATWDPIPNLITGTFTSYRVFIKLSSDADFPGTASATITDIATGTYTFNSLVNGVAYDVRVQAVTSANGVESSLNTAAVYLIPATIPTAPRITLSQSDTSTVTARWNSNGDGGSALTGYTIAVSAGGTAKTCTFSFVSGTTEYSCAITGLTGGSTVSATAIATNLIGNSATTTAVPLKFIGAILAPTAAVVTNGSTQAVVAFTINENGDQIVSFEYSFDGISFLPLAGTTSPLTFTGLTNGTSYNLYLRGKGAVNGVGATSAAFVLTPVAPAPVAVVTPVTPAPVVVAGPPPSTLKTITSPKILRDDNGYYCEIGKYVFLREGRTEETPKLTTRVFSLLLNGKVIDTLKSAIDKVSFTKSDTYLDSTLTCQVEVGQENLTTTSYSLNSVEIAAYSLTKKNAIEAADAKYYKDRQDAYSKKDLEFARLLAIKNTAISTSKSSKDTLAASLTYQKAYTAASDLWKKDLADAATNRVLAKELAQKQYLDALEAAGISIYPVAAKAVVTPTPMPTPTPKPTPTPTPTPTATNVQPTAEMKKVGTFYMATGSYFLNDAAKLSLKALALKINASEVKQVLVYGHTDSRGGVNNTWLSQQRAKAVASYLRPLLRGKKLVIGWYASRKPIASGTSKSDLAKNRRVEIYVK